MEKGKYLNLWKDKLSMILSIIKEGGGEKQLDSEEFYQVGDRNSSGYGFRLDITNGIVPTKNGTAVARDLKEVIDGCTMFREIAKNKQITIRMGKDFRLIMKVTN